MLNVDRIGILFNPHLFCCCCRAQNSKPSTRTLSMVVTKNLVVIPYGGKLKNHYWAVFSYILQSLLQATKPFAILFDVIDPWTDIHGLDLLYDVGWWYVIIFLAFSWRPTFPVAISATYGSLQVYQVWARCHLQSLNRCLRWQGVFCFFVCLMWSQGYYQFLI